MQQRTFFTAPARRLLVGLLVVSLAAAGLGSIAPATAEPGEDGAAPSAGAYYDATPIDGWMSERAGDRIHDFAQIGNTVYVAGTFSGVRPSRTGPVTWQSNLAAFDATTGALLPGFAPAFDGTVYSLAVSPDGSRLYAGGTFTTVNGGDHRRLVALDPGTGAPVTSFDADVSGGSVRSVVVGGTQLYIGGNFSDVEGVSRTRLARVDAATGAVDQAWAPTAQGDIVYTLELPSDGSRLYVGGRFSSINGVAATSELAALDATTGAPIGAFTGQPGREVFDLVAADDGRLYVAEGGAGGRAEAFDASGGLLGRWDTNGDVQAVEMIGGLVFFGGHDFGPLDADHVAVVDPDDLAIFDVEAFRPPPNGGDGVWAFHATADELWVGGQSSDPYHGFARYASTAAPPPREDLVSVGANWRYLDDHSDQGTAWRGNGFDDSAWPSGPAQLGFGDGDEVTTLQPGGTTYWFRRPFGVTSAAALSDLRLSLQIDDGAVAYVNGTEVARHNMPAGPITATTRASTTAFGAAESMFTTFDVPDGVLVDGPNALAVEVHQVTPGSSDISFDAQMTAVGVTPDTEPPSVPASLQWSNRTDTSFTLGWGAATDNSGIDHYEVFRDGTSIGVTPLTSLAVDGLTPSTTYQMTVEAVDAAGNRSGPSSPFVVTTLAAAPQTIEAIARGANWRFLDDGSDQGSAWRELGFDASSWSVGPAELGVGDGDEATAVRGGPVTYWFRRSFSVASAAAVSALDLELLADDGAVVYLNGTEVARDNMPAGAIAASTNAVDYRFGVDEQAFNSFSLPTAPLVDGVNVLAVEVHQASGSIDLSFDAILETTGGEPDTSPPTVPTGLSAGTVGDTSVTLGWDASTDDIGVDHYDVFVDGAAAGSSLGPTYTVTGLTPSTTHQVTVEAVDGAGNRSGLSPVLEVTTLAAPPAATEAIARGANWRFLDDGSDQGSAWRELGFDASSWSVGPAELGVGDGDEATAVRGGPVTYWFRRSFSVASAAAVSALDLELLADDGAVVYLNGTEVARDNMPAGAIAASTNAVDYRFGVDEQAFNSFSLPTAPLVDGVNVLAVEVHQAPGSGDLSFDAILETTGGEPDTSPPAVPTGLSVDTTTDTSATFSWAASTDDVAVDHYDVFVDGTSAGSSLGTSRTITGLDPSTTYQLAVEAVDGSGNRSARSAAVPATTAAAPGGAPATFIPQGSVWSYLDTGVDPGPTWTAPGFDAGSWATGAAELGFADGDETTVMVGGHVTYWFRRTFTAPVAANVRDLTVTLLADDGAVVYVNGVELVRDNMPGGPISPTTLASTYRFGSAERAHRTFAVPSTALVDGVNTIAVEVHQADRGSADLGFDLGLTGIE